MGSSYDPRWGDDPRSRDVERPDLGRGSRGATDGREPPSHDPRDLLERHRTPEQDRAEARQVFYAGVRKPRELEHDAQCYRAYLEAAERLQQRGCRPTRVVSTTS